MLTYGLTRLFSTFGTFLQYMLWHFQLCPSCSWLDVQSEAQLPIRDDYSIDLHLMVAKKATPAEPGVISLESGSLQVEKPADSELAQMATRNFTAVLFAYLFMKSRNLNN
jgi:hypothetical protein